MNQNVADVLKHVADKLDVPIEQLWNGLIAYAPFTFYQWAVQTLVVVILFCVSLTILIVSLRKTNFQDKYMIGACICGFLLIISGSLASSVGLGQMADAMAARYAPEAWATSYVVKALSNR